MAAVADAPEHVVSIVGAFCGEVVEDATSLFCSSKGSGHFRSQGACFDRHMDWEMRPICRVRIGKIEGGGPKPTVNFEG